MIKGVGHRRAATAAMCAAAVLSLASCYSGHFAPSGNVNDGGHMADGDASPPGRRIVELVGPDRWSWFLERTLAVAPDGTVFVVDRVRTRVYAVVDGEASIYLDRDDLLAAATANQIDVLQLAMGPDGFLYLYSASPPVTDVPSSYAIFVSDGPHQVEMLHELPVEYGYNWGEIAIETPREVLLTQPGPLLRVGDDGITELFPSGGTPDGQFVAHAGRVYRVEGSPGGDAYAGDLDAPPLSVLLSAASARQGLHIEWSAFIRFSGVAIDPSGGVIINAAIALLHVNDDGSFEEIRTEPAFDTPSRQWEGAPIGVDAEGRIYLLHVDSSTIFTVEPAGR